MLKAIALSLIIANSALAQAPVAPVPAVPPLPPPLGLKPTREMIECGRALFFDTRLSGNGTIACASCHNPATGWSDRNPLALGIVQRRTGRAGVGNRHSPTLINVAYSPFMFWDGRALGTAQQSLLPLVNPVEMGNRSEADVLTRVRSIPGYVRMFEKAYGPPTSGQGVVDPLRLAHAIASFEQTIVSFDAPIDRRLAGELDALSPEAEAGFGVFLQQGCMSCHKPPQFTDFLFHNSGTEFAARNPGERFDQGRAAVLPIQFRTPGMQRAFKTATLREVGRRGPFMHHGAFPDLARVVRHYGVGGQRFDGKVDPQIDPRVAGMRFNEAAEKLLVIFLEEAFASEDYPMVTAPEEMPQ